MGIPAIFSLVMGHFAKTRRLRVVNSGEQSRMRQFLAKMAIFASVLAVAGSGCSVRKTVGATGSLLKTTITTTGKLAGQTLKTGGELAKTGVKAAVDVVRPSLVTVVQESGKTVRRLPWKEGLTLYAATQKAQLDSGVKAIQILRGERVIERSIEEVRRGERDLPLEEGDVIKLIR